MDKAQKGDVAEGIQYDRADRDMHLEPDFSTLAVVPWEEDPTAQVIHDAYHADGRPVEIAPRQVLRRIIQLYENRGWVPVVAPEIEFYVLSNFVALPYCDLAERLGARQFFDKSKEFPRMRELIAQRADAVNG